jgi:hypothetical protein
MYTPSRDDEVAAGTSRIAGGNTLIADLADVPDNLVKSFKLNPGK